MIGITNLLQQVSFIQKKHDEFAKITGANFNIFSTMNMETHEVNTHSAIIGELLNPNGSHGQGSIFLDLFIENLKNKFNKKEENIKLIKFDKLVNEKICERTISINNNWADVTGGRIDIIIEDAKQICIIETKINAEDQDFQLIRYHNYATKRKKEFCILYLTKEGKSLEHEEKDYLQNDYLEIKPDEDISVEGYNFHYEERSEFELHKIDNEGKAHIHQCLYYPISFSDDIKNWLEKCLEKTVSLPTIRETLQQYINLIKKITNQSINNKMSLEIVEKMQKNISESFEIVRNIEPLKSSLYNQFMAHIENYAKDTKLKINKDSIDKKEKYGLILTPEFWDTNLQISVFFEGKNYTNLYVGIEFPSEFERKNEFRNKFKAQGFKESDWGIWKYSTNKDWADDAEIWKSVEEGEEYQEIINVINEIIEIEK